MDYSLLFTILSIPLTGTVVGAACVFFQKKDMPQSVRKTLMGFAAGVMVAASVWSLLIPSIEFCDSYGAAKVLPATVGFFVGILFLLCLDHFTPHQHIASNVPEGPQSRLSRTSKLALAVTIHNIPEGIAVGIALAGAVD